AWERLVAGTTAGRMMMRANKRSHSSAVRTSDTSSSARGVQLEIQRAMSGEQRFLMPVEMSLFARELAKERISAEHPEWTHSRVALELVRLALLPAPMPARLR